MDSRQMTQQQCYVVKKLIDFFQDSFSEDLVRVGDWVAQGGDDFDKFYDDIQELEAYVSA